jgi:hypothetical protein
MQGDPESSDEFGYSLKAADFNNDGYPDLAIGILYEKNFVGIDAGGVGIMYGTPNGLDDANNSLTFNSILISRSAEEFGKALSAGDYNGDGLTDLAIGIPQGKAGAFDYAGAVAVRYNTGDGIPGPVGQDYWHQDLPGILDDAAPYDYFGGSLR